MGWVETQVPCMIYCGDELCNCEARFFYEEEDDWSILDRKGPEAKKAYEKYLSKLQAYSSNPLLGVDAEQSKVISMLEGLATVSALK